MIVLGKATFALLGKSWANIDEGFYFTTGAVLLGDGWVEHIIVFKVEGVKLRANVVG